MNYHQVFLLFIPFLFVDSRPRPHLPAQVTGRGRGEWRLLKTCVSDRRYCTFTVEDQRMVGECVEAEEFCWNIGYGWVAEEETILPTLPLPVGEEQGID